MHHHRGVAAQLAQRLCVAGSLLQDPDATPVISPRGRRCRRAARTVPRCQRRCAPDRAAARWDRLRMTCNRPGRRSIPVRQVIPRQRSPLAQGTRQLRPPQTELVGRIRRQLARRRQLAKERHPAAREGGGRDKKVAERFRSARAGLPKTCPGRAQLWQISASRRSRASEAATVLYRRADRDSMSPCSSSAGWCSGLQVPPRVQFQRIATPGGWASWRRCCRVPHLCRSQDCRRCRGLRLGSPPAFAGIILRLHLAMSRWPWPRSSTPARAQPPASPPWIFPEFDIPDFIGLPGDEIYGGTLVNLEISVLALRLAVAAHRECRPTRRERSPRWCSRATGQGLHPARHPPRR